MVRLFSCREIFPVRYIKLMVLQISHRGNISGPNTASHGENHPTSIIASLHAGYHCEIDLRVIDGKYWLGHSAPQFDVPLTFLYNSRIYIHCKDINTLYLIKDKPLGCDIFFHDTDDAALTKEQKIWTHFNNTPLLTPHSIAVLPENTPKEYDLSNCYGVCSDFVGQLKTDLTFRP